MDKNFYNEASASKLGWAPSWFGEKYFDDKLSRAIKKWQKKHALSSRLSGARWYFGQSAEASPPAPAPTMIIPADQKEILDIL